MSTTEIPDVTVLAAIDRAERHRGRPGVPVWLVFEHLGIPRRSEPPRESWRPDLLRGWADAKNEQAVSGGGA
jgi:hypothetical protein